MPNSPTDRELLYRAAGGEEAAFAELYHRHAVRLLAWLMYRRGCDEATALDVRQRVFLQLLESKAFRRPRNDGPDDLAPLLYVIAAGVLKNDHRSLNRRRRHEQTYRERQESNAVPIEPRDTLPIAAALSELPHEQRTCITLRYQDGLTTEEIAEIMDCRPGTVKSRLHYGFKKLATLLHPHTTP